MTKEYLNFVKEVQEKFVKKAVHKDYIKTAEKLENDAQALFSPPKSICKLKYDQADWGTHIGKHKPKEKNYCGTVACAAGHIALSGISDLKARWVPNIGYDYKLGKEVEKGQIIELGFNGEWSKYLGYERILEDYYGIAMDERESLFGPQATLKKGEAGRKEIAAKMIKLASIYRTKALAESSID